MSPLCGLFYMGYHYFYKDNVPNGTIMFVHGLKLSCESWLRAQGSVFDYDFLLKRILLIDQDDVINSIGQEMKINPILI